MGRFYEKLDSNIPLGYFLMTPQEVVDNQCGICVDQVELERDWFEKHNYHYEILSIHIFRENENLEHTFLIYFENNEWH